MQNTELNRVAYEFVKGLTQINPVEIICALLVESRLDLDSLTGLLLHKKVSLNEVSYLDKVLQHNVYLLQLSRDETDDRRLEFFENAMKTISNYRLENESIAPIFLNKPILLRALSEIFSIDYNDLITQIHKRRSQILQYYLNYAEYSVKFVSQTSHES